MLKDLPDTNVVKQTKFLDYIRAQMAIKSTKQKVYFKKVVEEIHQKVINLLGLERWYNGLTIQSKGVSRNYIAYYLAIYLRYYV